MGRTASACSRTGAIGPARCSKTCAGAIGQRRSSRSGWKLHHGLAQFHRTGAKLRPGKIHHDATGLADLLLRAPEVGDNALPGVRSIMSAIDAGMVTMIRSQRFLL